MVYLYHIHRAYMKAEAWSGDPITRERTGVHSTRPNYDLTHRQRYEVIARWLTEKGVSPPPYKQSGS